MLQHGTRLSKGDAGKELNKLPDRHAVFKVLEECCYRHSRPTKHPCSADALGVAFHYRAS